MATKKISQITDKSSRTMLAIFREATQVLGHDYQSTKPDEINQLNLQFIARIKEGGRTGEKAMDDLVKVNYLQVVSIAKQYRWSSMEQVDLIQEGILGVIEAVGHYNETAGQSFGAFAKSFIKKRISTAISTLEKMIYLPKDRMKQVRRMERFSMNFYQEFGREPTIDELLESEGMESTGSKGYENRMMLQDMRNAFSRPTSYDITVNDEDGCYPVRLVELMEGDSRADDLIVTEEFARSLNNIKK